MGMGVEMVGTLRMVVTDPVPMPVPVPVAVPMAVPVVVVVPVVMNMAVIVPVFMVIMHGRSTPSPGLSRPALPGL